jgi:hypothetical protein
MGKGMLHAWAPVPISLHHFPAQYSQERLVYLIFNDRTAAAALMLSLGMGTLQGTRISRHSNEICANACYLMRYTHTTVMVACIIVDSPSTLNQRLQPGTMQRVRRTTQQAAPPM